SSGTSVDLRGVRFADAMHGLAVGDAGTVLVTSDAGAHWNAARVEGAERVDLRAAAVAANVGVWLAAGSDGTVVRAVDGGASWSSLVVDGATNLRGLASDAEGTTVLAVDDAGSIWSSVDVGAHFTREASLATSLDAVALDDDGGPALAVGAGGTVAT